jgi:hypothetical protein
MKKIRFEGKDYLRFEHADDTICSHLCHFRDPNNCPAIDCGGGDEYIIRDTKKYRREHIAMLARLRLGITE